MIRETADIAIVGAGIAGLTAALALARQDRASVVYERARVMSEAGAGIQLSPNASRILIDLGLERSLSRHVVAPDAIVVRDGETSRPLARIPLGEDAEARYGAPYWVIHRADLQDVLVRAAMAHSNIILKRGATFTQLTENPHSGRLSVTLETLAGVETRNHDAIIGADGIWSQMRSVLGDRTKPQFSGFRAYRAVVSRDLLPPRIRENIVGAWIGRTGHVVHYPVISGFAVNLVAITTDNEETRGWNEPVPADVVEKRFTEWHKDVVEAVKVPGETWRSWALYDRPPEPFHGHGATTLIGDAAHPMLPFLAQGGAMGIEDAVTLADEFVVHVGRPDLAFRAFEKLRAGRVKAVQKAARKNGRIFHMDGVTGAVRNAVLNRMSPSALMSRYDWIYGHRTSTAGA